MKLEYDTVVEIDRKCDYDYIIIRSNHIGTIPIGGTHVRDLLEISDGALELIATMDENISSRVKFYSKETSIENKFFIEDLYTAINEKDKCGRKIASAMIVVNGFHLCDNVSSIRLWSMIENAWGDKSTSNCSYISAERVEKEEIFMLKKNNAEVSTVLIISIDCEEF